MFKTHKNIDLVFLSWCVLLWNIRCILDLVLISISAIDEAVLSFDLQQVY